MRGAFLVRTLWEDRDVREKLLEKFKSDNVLTTITLVLTLVSEIELELRFGLAERGKYMWTMLRTHKRGEAAEIYDLRYKGLL